MGCTPAECYVHKRTRKDFATYLSESRITRIARIIDLGIQGCMRPISIFAQQIGNQQ